MLFMNMHVWEGGRWRLVLVNKCSFLFLTLQTLKNPKRNHHLISPTVLGSPDQHDGCFLQIKNQQQRPEITTELPSAIYQPMAKINCLENTASLIVFFLFLRLGLVICCLFSPLMCTNNLFFFVFFCLFVQKL